MPLNLYSTCMHELFVPVRTSFSDAGCHESTASNFVHSPSRAMYAFPLPPSSPGQPKNTIVPSWPLCCRYSLTANAAASEPTPRRLWPQPWPLPSGIMGFFSVTPEACERPDRASNSPKMPITGLPLPNEPQKAVSIPLSFSVTVKPCSRSTLQYSSVALNSLRESSGFSQISSAMLL